MKLKSNQLLLIGGVLSLMSFQVLSDSSQPVFALEEFHSLAHGSIANLGFTLPINDIVEEGLAVGVEGSAVKASVYLLANDEISFKYRLLTNEDISESGSIYNDYVYVTLDGKVQVWNYVGNSDVQFFDFPEGTSEFEKYTNEIPVSRVLPGDFSPGLYALGLGIVDVVDADFSSAILLYDVMFKRNGVSRYVDFGNTDPEDNFQMIGDVRFIQNNFGFETSSGYASLLITTTPDFVPVPGAMLLMGTGLLGLIAYGRKKAA